MNPIFIKGDKKLLKATIADSKTMIREMIQMEFDFGQRNDLKERFARTCEVLGGFESQYNMLLDVIDEKFSSSKAIELFERYRPLGIYMIPTTKLEDICVPMMNYIANIVYKYLTKLHQAMLTVKKEGMTDAAIIEFRACTAKLGLAIEYIPIAATFDKHDLFSVSENSKRWTELKKTVESEDFGLTEEGFKSVQRYYQLDKSMYSTMYTEKDNLHPVYRDFRRLILLGYYLFYQEKAQEHSKIVLNEKTQSVLKVWNLLQTGIFKFFSFLLRYRIRFQKLLHFQRLYPEITLDLVKSKITSWINLKEEFLELPIAMKDKELENTLDDLEVPSQDKVPVRLLSAKPLPDDPKETINNPYFDGCIIHIHGGGWVSLSTDIYQTITREWAKKCGKPVFSIEYRLAPEHCYPAGLDDCWQAYNWIIDHAEKVFGIRTNKVILVGDSAGGNLATALMALLIKTQRRLPDGIMLMYPALSIEDTQLAPSLMGSLEDIVLSAQFLKLCRSLYLGEYEYKGGDPLLSPSLMSDEYLEKFPPLRIVVGSGDPLRDECYRMLERLKKLGRDAQMKLYEGIPHGFINLAFPTGFPGAKTCLHDCTETIHSLLELTLNL